MRRELTSEGLRKLMAGTDERHPEEAHARYPALSRDSVLAAVDDFLADVDPGVSD